MFQISSVLREFSEQLIAEVRKRPCLYNKHIRDYKDRSKQENAWQEVADILGIANDLAKKRWTNIRSSYCRSKNKQGQAPFYLAPCMSFIDPYLTPWPVNSSGASVSASPSEPDVQGEEDSQSDSSLPLMSPPTRSRSPSPQSPLHSPAVNRHVREFPPKKKRPRNTNSFETEDWQESAKAFFMTQCASANAVKGAAASTSGSTSSAGTEQKNPDWEYLKGLLPQIEQLEKRNRRLYFQKISNLLFTMLDEQDDAAEEREVKPAY
ncbi:CG3919, isoform B [Elysia marginata]|uniref:CG3919, isoform B n=1 Tax=Elysia marginata TaxID=1093978 RepID=A0AAV4HD24_9GAST|nr:CG3919, isoform B [Elysia marginata]